MVIHIIDDILKVIMYRNSYYYNIIRRRMFFIDYKKKTIFINIYNGFLVFNVFEIITLL